MRGSASRFCAPDYEYQGVNASAPTPPNSLADTSESAHVASGAAPPVPRSARAASTRAAPKQLRALLIAVAFVLSLAAGMGWLVVEGVTSGTSNVPSKRPSQMRAVMRVRDPVMYWTAIGVYSALGLATLALGVWGAREWARLERAA